MNRTPPRKAAAHTAPIAILTAIIIAAIAWLGHAVAITADAQIGMASTIILWAIFIILIDRAERGETGEAGQ